MRWLPLLLLCACGSLESPYEAGSTGTGAATGGGGGGGGGGTATGGPTTGGGACAPLDEWDDESAFDPGMGDTCEVAPRPLAAIDDTGAAPVTIRGNLHVAGDVDWYGIDVIDTGDDLGRGYEDFHLQIRITEGADAVEMIVVPYDCGNTAECAADGAYDEFSFKSEDNEPDEEGELPDDPRACGPVGSKLNECPDYSGRFLVKVTAIDGDVVCTPYELSISNGVW